MKPGWKTTEFWLTLFSNVSALALLLTKTVPGPVPLIVGGVATLGYSIARGLAKTGGTDSGAGKADGP